MSTPVKLVLTVSGKTHTVKVSSRRQAEREITALFPTGDWSQKTRQARRDASIALGNAWTARFGKGSSETPKARKARPSEALALKIAEDLATWHVVAERGEQMKISLEERRKPLTQKEQERVEELALNIEKYSRWEKERHTERTERRMTRKRSNRALSSLEAIKGCKAPKQGPAIEMALTPARKLVFKELRKARAARKAAINAAKRALEARFSSLGPVVINAAVETVVDRLEAVGAEINCEAIKNKASLEVVFKATRKERNDFFEEQRA